MLKISVVYLYIIVSMLFIACTPNPCLNGGTCADADEDGTAECACSGGYTGNTCATPPAGKRLK